MKTRAFTLIELLIVVAIITILAAIATINYLEAQARAKTSRAHHDMRVIDDGLAAYRVDHGAYPPAADGDFQYFEPLFRLTTPIAYLTSIPKDAFGPACYDFNENMIYHGYEYKDAVTTSVGMPGETYGYIWEELPDEAYMIHSCGPNGIWNVSPYIEYDPSNGTVSAGDITLFGPR